jgi:hypothetical protein
MIGFSLSNDESLVNFKIRDESNNSKKKHIESIATIKFY